MQAKVNGVKPSHHVFSALLIFMIGALFSVGLWEHQKQQEIALVQERFVEKTKDFKHYIQLNLTNYEQALNGISGLFGATDTVTKVEWDAYIQAIQKANQHYPGIIALGFALSEPGREVVTYSTYFDGENHNPVNENLLNHPNRKRATEIADETGQIVLVSQMQPLDASGHSKKTYFGLFKTITKNDKVYGHAYVEVDFNTMMARYLNGVEQGVLLKVFYKVPNQPDQLLYETPTQQNMTNYKSLFSDIQTLEVNKSIWNLSFRSTPIFDAEVDRHSAAIVFFSCIVISFLGAVVTWALNTVRARSDLLRISNKKIMILNRELEDKVKRRTKELERSNDLLGKTNEMVSLKNELLSLMQGCTNIKDVLILAGEFFKKIFPNNDGRIYLYNRNTLSLDLVSHWDVSGRKPQMSIKMSDCFALHYFNIYRVKGIGSELICNHMREEYNKYPYFCVPIIDNENIFGLISMTIMEVGEERLIESVESIEKAISLTCLNLDLRVQLEYDAIHDPLTGLYNRRYFEESLLREIMKSHRIPISLVILMVDVDDFKQVNDTYGHQMGDEVLRSLANLLKYEVRVSDVACRFGGEEFIVMLETSLEYGFKRAEQLRKAASELKFHVDEKTISGITISVGIAAFPAHGESMDKLVKHADEALYRAKSQGKNRTIIFGEFGSGPHKPMSL